MTVGAAITEGPVDPNILGTYLNPFPTTASRNAAYPVAPALSTPAYVADPTPGNPPIQYQYVGPGVDDSAWVAMPTPQVGGAVLLRDIARQAAANDLPQCIKKRVAVAILGQSNEVGAARYWVSGSPPENRTFRSLLNPSIKDPIPPHARDALSTVSPTGSWWSLLVDELYRIGVDVAAIRNCAIGSMSFNSQVCGQTAWNPNSPVYAKRSSIGGGDLGDYGQTYTPSGTTKVFRCIQGRKRYLFYNDPTTPYTVPGTVARTAWSYVVTDDTGAYRTGAAQPNWAGAVSVGDQVTDGTVIWELVALSGGLTPAGTILSSGKLGFDPLGVLARLKSQLDAISYSDCEEKWVFISHGQADQPASSATYNTYLTWYQTAITNICNYLVAQGYKVAVGNSVSGFLAVPYVGDAGDGKYPMQCIQEAVNAAVTALATPNVIRGGDLFAALGPNPNTYPEVGNVMSSPSVHLCAQEMPKCANEWRRALIAAGW